MNIKFLPVYHFSIVLENNQNDYNRANRISKDLINTPSNFISQPTI